MKKLLSIFISLLLVFSVMPMILVSAADPVVEIIQDFESDSSGVSATNSTISRTTSQFYQGAYSYSTLGKTGVWNQNNQYISSANLKNYVKIAIPATANITGGVGFYAMKTQSNTSKFEAIGVQFADGTQYYTKFSTSTVTKSWANINFVGKTMYKYGDTATSKTLAVEDFNNATNKVTHLILVTGGSTSSGYETYIDNVYYETDVAKSSYIIMIDGQKVAEVPFGELYTMPTPPTHYCYTDGTNYYYGGEIITPDDDIELVTEVEITKVVYTMDEGSRMEAASTLNVGTGISGDADYVDVNGDYKLALKVKSDQFGYFKLPSNWSSKPYFKPVSISVSYDKNVTSSVGFKSVDFSQSITGTNAPSGNTYNIFTSTGAIEYVPKTYTINITEDMYDYYYFSTKFYASANYTTENPVYAYVDDVTITYEYDFNYTPGVDVTMVSGAQVRFNQVTGLRYKAQVDADAIENFVANGYTVTMGTLIAPADYYASYTDMTLDTDKTILNVVTTGYYNEENGTIAGSIGKIKTDNIGRNFIARAYVKLEKDGEVFVSYADDNDNTRSLKQVSISALADDTADYTQEQYDLLDTWSKANDWA